MSPSGSTCLFWLAYALLKWSEVLSLKSTRCYEHHALYLLYFTVCWHFLSHWSQNIQQTGPIGVLSFHTGVIKVWSSGMWHSGHRECSEPVSQRCCVTSAKPKIIFHTAIFWHVKPCQLTLLPAFLHPEETGSCTLRNITTRSTSVINDIAWNGSQPITNFFFTPRPFQGALSKRVLRARRSPTHQIYPTFRNTSSPSATPF